MIGLAITMIVLGYFVNSCLTTADAKVSCKL